MTGAITARWAILGRRTVQTCKGLGAERLSGHQKVMIPVKRRRAVGEEKGPIHAKTTKVVMMWRL